ncbi:hypothetical protein [Agromyces silvae]|uniref:hypothetical protein n=1 Tax=Agromyces silvae TaxID=3388266 RepID=UPI00280B7E00|nr:hypothetical protein [Agromyces protaetiae]
MEDYWRYEQEIVRLFYDYVDSVLWFPYPVRYEEARLSPALTDALRAWGRRHGEGLAAGERWPSPELPARLTAELPGLAARVGDELGSAFEVEYASGSDDPMDQSRKLRYRSTEPPTNPDASAAFGALAEAARAERAALARRVASEPGGSRAWFAFQPGGGTIYRPPSP